MKKLLTLIIALTLAFVVSKEAKAYYYVTYSTPVVYYTTPVVYTTPVRYTYTTYSTYYAPRYYSPCYYTYWW